MSENMLGNALEATSGPFKDFFEKLGGEEGEEWFSAFKRFLRKENPWESEWREIEELSIEIPALARPTLKELRALCPWIRSIEYDVSPTEVVTLRLGTFLRSGEERISHEKYEQRCKPHLASCLGHQHAAWLVEHQDEFPEFMALLGKVYVDFPGIVVLGVGGSRFLACLGQDGKHWGLSWRWTGDGLYSDVRVASSK
ncbi:MAG: hypothetical protein Q8R20_01855 [Nanoarchaeota archaeon]|nr:hypothetical protein [Nanoarchaeota archaeon]